MMTHQSDLPNYCQDDSAATTYFERVLAPAIHDIALAAADAVIYSRPATRIILPFEADLLAGRLEPAIRRMPDTAIEALALELLDTVPSFEVWSEPLQADDEDQMYDRWREMQDR